MDELTSTQGIVALAGLAVAVAALVLATVLAVQLRRLRADQRAILGNAGEDDLVAHAARLGGEFRELAAYVEDVAQRLTGRMQAAESRLDRTVAHRALVRYDAYQELSGQQSASLALLDANACGVVISSILHRDQARLYTKRVIDGRGELPLSPEEEEAVSLALSDAQLRS